MSVVEIASVCAPLVAALAAAIAFRQMRLARRSTESATLPVLTASIESRETPDGSVVCLFLTNSAASAPALDVQVKTTFTPRSASEPSQTAVRRVPVILAQSRHTLPCPPGLAPSGLLVDDLVVFY